MDKTVTDLKTYIRQQLSVAALNDRTCLAQGRNGETRAFMQLNEDIKYGLLSLRSGSWLDITDPENIGFVSSAAFFKEYRHIACIIPSSYGKLYSEHSEKGSPCKNCDFLER